MIWEFWIERHRTSGRQRSGESFTPTEPAEGRREHEARNFGELWKWRRCGNVGNPKAGFPTFPQRLGNLAKAARFPHFHSSYGSLLRLNRTTPAERTGCGGKVEIQKAGFPTFPPHRWPAAQGRNLKSVYDVPGTLCIPCAGLDRHSCRRPAALFARAERNGYHPANNVSPLKCL